ncbi:MAG: hypothetical protein JJU11_00910, partial [Candidatus Sumerlaeia bacterium]|nr:hypothetical protein [Candidatus Sumerlaeia bacterium]
MRPSHRRRARREHGLWGTVGSVTASTNADGDLVSLRHADAFGNTLEDWETGLWTGGSGWGHNTKEQSAATGLSAVALAEAGLVYM